MAAMITGLPIGLFLWTCIGIAVGYAWSLINKTRGTAVLSQTVAGLVGAMAGGLAIGLTMHGSDARMGANFLAIAGALAASFVWSRVRGRQAV